MLILIFYITLLGISENILFALFRVSNALFNTSSNNLSFQNNKEIRK